MFLFDMPVAERKERKMARIRKEDHARVLALVEAERRPVREIATEFGVTPAAIYALLNRLRQPAVAEGGEVAHQTPLALDAMAEAVPEPVAPEPFVLEPFVLEPVEPQPEPATPALPIAQSAAPESQVLRFSTPPARPARGEGHGEPTGKAAGKAGGIGARRAKGGVGLITRTADGEETTVPFRSLDDLLSAIKPILREGARSPDPVWFSIQPVDLSEIEMDAA